MARITTDTKCRESTTIQFILSHSAHSAHHSFGTLLTFPTFGGATESRHNGYRISGGGGIRCRRGSGAECASLTILFCMTASATVLLAGDTVTLHSADGQYQLVAPKG